MKKRVILSTVLAGVLLSSSALYASYNDSVSKKEERAINNPASVKGHTAAQAKVEESRSKEEFMRKMDAKYFQSDAKKEDMQRLKNVVNQEADQHRQSLQKVPKEIAQALRQTVTALKALQKRDTKTAKDALNKATKLFDTALKNNPKLTLVPVADAIEVHDFTGDSKLVKHIIKSAQDLLDDYDTQAARAILMPLEDEMVMTTQYLPMGMYPLATKEALKELNKGKAKEAFSILVTALNGIVMKTTIVPLPLITAQSLVVEASKLNKKEKEKATKLLDLAQDELEKAVYLGYTKKHAPEYKMLQKEIENIEKEIKGKNIVAKLYEKIKKDFTSLLSKHEAESTEKKH
ncbi:YfdX family protein [Sulfurimonas sp. SWIR-19]|uniref:YfdX family protein n=1 Tax=Sulfurimonas sp. SWIR-19 TaxID=2878390 RepID=UPI001CF0DF50|nr:YfdX family protein [Sulfurimonas sp. SWIR-19]UCN00798.1 YfdX family protein [Sulfurimonas sp. SWIR-19]